MHGTFFHDIPGFPWFQELKETLLYAAFNAPT